MSAFEAVRSLFFINVFHSFRFSANMAKAPIYVNAFGKVFTFFIYSAFFFNKDKMPDSVFFFNEYMQIRK